MSRLIDNLLIFGRVLRRTGFQFHSGRLAELVEALGYVDLAARDDVYNVCRALLVHRQDQIAIFDLAFAAFWRDHHDGRPGTTSRGTHPGEPASMIETGELLAAEELDRTTESGADSSLDRTADDDGPDADAPAEEERLKTWSEAGALAG